MHDKLTTLCKQIGTASTSTIDFTCTRSLDSEDDGDNLFYNSAESKLATNIRWMTNESIRKTKIRKQTNLNSRVSFST